MTPSTCETCGGPTVWTHTHQRVWCAVYGTHPAAATRPIVHAAVLEAAAAPDSLGRVTRADYGPLQLVKERPA
jgi:hypothetical protein